MANKRSLQLFKKLKKLRSQERMAEATNPDYGRLMLSLLTPTQYAELFPKWYQRSLPDVGGFRAALTKRTQDEQQKYFDDIDQKLGTSSPGARERIESEGTTPGAGRGGSSSARLRGSFSAANYVSLLKQAGFSDKDATLMAAVGMQESSGNIRAANDKNPDRERSYGLFQININAHPFSSPEMRYAGVTSVEDLYDPAKNAKVAYYLYYKTGTGIKHWGGYTDGGYRQYLGAAEAAAGAPAGIPSAGTGQTTPPGAPAGGTAPDFTKYVMYESSKGQCGIGVRKLAAKMYGHSPFDTDGLSVGGDEHAGSLSRGNNYFQRSGLFKNGRGIGSDNLTSDYLDSLPIGTVISSEGGHRGGHVQIKIGPGKWASDFSQNGYKFIRSGYDNFVIHEPNETGLSKLSENGVMQAGATGTPAASTTGEPQVQPQRVSEVPPAINQSVVDNTTVVEPEVPDRQSVNSKTVEEKAKEAAPTASVNKPEKQAAGPRTFSVNREALISAIRETEDFKKEAGLFADAVPDDTIFNGFLADRRTQELFEESGTKFDSSTNQVTIGNYNKFQKLLGMDTSKILTEIPANTPAYAGGGSTKVKGPLRVTKLDKKHRGDTTLVSDSSGKQFTVNPEKENISVDPDTGVMNVKPNRQQMPMEKLMAVVRRQESGSFEGNYGADLKDPKQHPRKKGQRVDSASGAYQYNDRTWKGVLRDELNMPDILEKYPRAVAAPREVQDMITEKRFQKWRNSGYTDDEIILNHFTGNRRGILAKGAQKGNPTPAQYRAAIASHVSEYDKTYPSPGVQVAKQEPKLETKLDVAGNMQTPQTSERPGFIEKAKSVAGLATPSRAETKPVTTTGSMNISSQPAPLVGPSRSAAESVGITQTPNIMTQRKIDTGAITPGKTTQMDLLREEMRTGFDNISSTQPQPQQQVQHVRAQRPIVTEMPDSEHQKMISTLPSAAKDPYGGVPSLERAANRAGFDQERPWAIGNKH